MTMRRVIPVSRQKQGRHRTNLFFAFRSSAIEARPLEPFISLQNIRSPTKL